MSHPYSPAAVSFGRRIRLAYIPLLGLMFVARMWGVHIIHEFLGSDAPHGEMVSIAGRLPAQSTEIVHAAFVHACAPQLAPADLLGRSIEAWTAEHARVARFLPGICTEQDPLCMHFQSLQTQRGAVAAAALAAAEAQPADRIEALGRLTAVQSEYLRAAERWVPELAERFTAQIKAQQQTVLLAAVAQVAALAILIMLVLEPAIRRLQRERSEVDRDQDARHELLHRLQKMASQLPGMIYQYRLRPDGTSEVPYSREGIWPLCGVKRESARTDADAVFALVHPDDLARVKETITRSAEQLTQWRDEYRLCLPDGREHWVLANASPEREADGSVLWHGFITDVTERRRVMQSIADARTLLESVLDAATEVAIIATDVQGLITVFNSGAQRMLKYRVEEMIGCSTPLKFHSEQESNALSNELALQLKRPISAFEALVHAAREGGCSVRECTYVRKDGSTLTVTLSVTAIRNAAGEINGYLEVATDVTERHQARESLLAAKEAAERANRAKSEFLATMSHEIRTPMNGVLGFANLLRDTPLDPEQREFVRTIESSGQALLAIINDILDFSKIEAGAMTLESISFDLWDAIEEVVGLLAARAEEKHLELVLSIAAAVPRRVRSDPGRLKQVLVNLIGNAIKFTHEGYVHVSVTVSGERALRQLRIDVRDTGIGISLPAQTSLFQKFTQADTSTTRRFGGTGLGLAICRRLVEIMGGKISVDSALGRGSTFTVGIPVHDIEVPKPEAPLPDFSGRRVLIIGHVEITRRVLEQQLSHWGATCACASSSHGAMAALEHALGAGEPFDWALIDHSTFGVEIDQFAQSLRADTRFAGLRLVLITTGGQVSQARELLQRGFAAYLVKPLVRFDLLREALLRARCSARPERSAARESSKASGGAPENRVRVLVVEDNAVNQKVAVRLLERQGCRVDVAANGAEAVEMTRHLPYRLVFMDCHMPDMDGFEATTRIRSREQELALPSLPIIALTASVLQEDRDRCLTAGMDDVIGKPIQPTDLARALQRFAGDCVADAQSQAKSA